ncbi:hypothetical protein PHISCL_04471 [Aspergillus sclerotialis]|uniref:Protein cms1 n=1 Tax=Aspergillus sclerotialis TaxID=2070753 RepID=A0A3A2ZJ87_9EURO|nr:hypothetical protein PHISCL_04471 [Aspergillus sclerotialis]
MPDQPPSARLSTKTDKKRKRQTEESSRKDTSPQGRSTNNKSSDVPSKKKLKKGKGELQQKQNLQNTEGIKGAQRENAINVSIGLMDGRLLADHLVQKARKLNKDLTAVELNDLCVSDSVFRDTTSFNSTRSLDQLATFLKTFSPDSGAGLSKSSEETGTPHTLVISPAALRAADVVRALRTFQNKESIIGKLFAKHIKLEEAKQFLQRARTGLGVGTPTRISDLIESGALKLNELERIVIDGSFIDQKQRGIFDMKETHFPLLQLLNRPELNACYKRKEKPARILVF